LASSRSPSATGALASVESTEAKAPVAEGEREEANTTPNTSAAEVTEAMDGVVVPQVAVTGGDPARQEAGMAPHMAVPLYNNPLIATGEATLTDAQNLNKTPEAVAAAARGAGGAQSGKLESAATATPSLNEEKEAEKIGQLIAKSFQATLEKQASDREYDECLNYLNDHGVLAGFTIKDAGMSKTASYQPGALEKIAGRNLPLTREDIVNAAYEHADLEKQAEDAEAQGRADAHALVEFIASMDKTASAQEVTEEEKIAELMQDPGVVNAIKVLKAKNLL